MSLTAVAPDQAVIDALSLDAAWEHAKHLEAERDGALRASREAQVRAQKYHDRYVKLANGVGLMLMEYESNPREAKPPAEYMAELVDLLKIAEAL